jgi:transposase-like protein
VASDPGGRGTAQIGAGHGERAPAERSTQRNGYRERRFDTRAGSLELFIPKPRSGSYFPSFLEPRTRSEQGLVAVVMESYVNGVSTRKVEPGRRAARDRRLEQVRRLANVPSP